jgi:hypothetical protein
MDHRRAAKSSFLRVLVLPTTVLGVILGNQFFSNTWACAIIPATIIAWFASVLADAAIPALRAGDRRSQMWRLVSVLLLGALAGALYPAWGKAAFRECFGVNPPPAVHDLRVVAKHYEGATEHTLFMEFNAEPEVVADLLKTGGFANTGDYITEWREGGGTWQALENALVGFRALGFSRRSFRDLKPMAEFEVYEAYPDAAVWNVLIWDRAADRVLVVNILG